MEKAIGDLIQQIHDDPAVAAVVVTGAGTQALAWLFGVAGASRTMLEARVPYAAAAFQDFIGQEPKKYVSPESSRLLAGNALQRALFLTGRGAAAEPGAARALFPLPNSVIGLSCTATIATDYVKRGAHRGHISFWTAGRIVTTSINLAKARRDRSGEEDLISRIIINALAEACGLDGRLALDLKARDELAREEIDLAAGVSVLLDGHASFVRIEPDGRVAQSAPGAGLLLSGSFNPLHKGHLGLARAAATLVGRPPAFELSAFNVDKPPLDRDDVLSRLAQFAGRHPLTLTNAPTFLEKARLLPGTIFVVGYDTGARIIAPRYYGFSEANRTAALDEIRRLGCRFMVAGRVDEGGRFREAAELPVPPGFADLFEPIPASLFRRDISSSEIRAKLAG